MAVQMTLLESDERPTLSSAADGRHRSRGGRGGPRSARRAPHRQPLTDDARVDWHLDETTREVGRRGVAAARAALAEAVRGSAA